MTKRIVEGLWDCPYCKTKAIGGLTKHCPCCGHPQDAGTKFYMGEKKNYLDEALAAQYGQGADWVCPFCGSLNRVYFKYCSNCAAPKDSSEKDYFSARPAPPDQPHPPSGQRQPPKRFKKKRWIVAGLIVALIAALLFAFWPRTYDATVAVSAWAREIDIEAYRTVQESDWSVPDGGRVYDQRTEFSHYVQVLDHYETRTREVSEEVYDGEEYHTSYSDNGDGTFTEETYSTPRYRTEWHTETYQEPVYRDEPVYATKYYYDIDKWVLDRTESSEGADIAPYWPEYTLGENERTGFMGEAYILSVETEDASYRLSLPLERWENFHKGDGVTITVVNGAVTELNGVAVD